MKIRALIGAVTIAFTLATQAGAAVVVDRSPASAASSSNGIQLAQYFRHYGGPYRGPVVRPYRPYYRRWVRRPYFGTVIAGVALGTIVTAAVIGAPPPPPAPNLCWYWADPALRSGYWDYCR